MCLQSSSRSLSLSIHVTSQDGSHSTSTLVVAMPVDDRNVAYHVVSEGGEADRLMLLGIGRVLTDVGGTLL